MLTSLARPLLHLGHLVTFSLLLLTGLLLFVPSLRAAVTGGYSQLIRSAHRWGGVAFVALPVLLVVVCGPRNVFVAPVERSLRTLWQGLHMGITLLFGVAFTLSGLAIWGKRLLSDAMVESSRSMHDWLTYAAIVLLAVHLVEIGMAGLLARIRAAAAGVQRSER
jgi:cytochrome b subunit of formate dehydrogenase